MDNDVSESPEDGEIVDYEPLPRPSAILPNSSFRSNNARTCSSNSSENSDSDSEHVSRKKLKILKRGSGRNKYNVWASQFQASELMDEICNWEAGLNDKVMDKSRNVESYYHFTENSEPRHVNESESRKRRQGEVVDLRNKLGQRHSKETDAKSHPRYLSELRVSPEDSVEDITQDITLKLCEEKEDLVLRAVTILGREKAIDIFNRTRNLEEEGGMMVMNGSRRRTPGGVFLQLIKKDASVSRDQINKIFTDDQKGGHKLKKSKAKSHQKKGSEGKTTPQTDVETDGLPVLLERKELEMSLKETSNDYEISMKNAVSSSASGNQEDPRQIAVYDDIFEDNPCDVEFT